MKKTFLLIPVLLQFGVVVFAQISVNNTDMPSASDTIRMSTGVAFTGMDPTLTGANYTWDYSQLTPVTQTIDTFLSVNSTATIYALYFANVGFNTNRSNLAERGTSFGAPGFSITGVFDFYYNSSSRYEQTGFGASVNGIPGPIAYSPHDTVYHFPMTYGEIDSSNYGYSIELPTLFSYKTNGFRHNEVDGWGSLATPYGTFNVLRVKTTLTEHDSIYIDTLGNGFSFNVSNQIQYKWIGKGEGEPLLQINTTGGVVTQIIYRDSARAGITAGIAPEEILTEGLKAYPNPSGTLQSIIYSLKEAADVKLEVYSMTGNKITTLVDGHQPADKHIYTLNVGDEKFSSGIYLLKFSANGKSYQQKLVVTK